MTRLCVYCSANDGSVTPSAEIAKYAVLDGYLAPEAYRVSAPACFSCMSSARRDGRYVLPLTETDR